MSETHLARLPRRIRGPRSDEDPRSPWGRVDMGVICILAGTMLTVSALVTRDTDLRSDRNIDLRDLAAIQTQRSEQLRKGAAGIRSKVEELGHKQGVSPELERQQRTVTGQAVAVPVIGPRTQMTPTDAPTDVKPVGADDGALVVCQQDIQTVVNVPWKGGVGAISTQRQRITTTSEIECVGNSVVLHGIPYTLPYTTEAIGDAGCMVVALKESWVLTIYR